MCRNSANPIKGLKRANGRSQCPNAVDYCQRHRSYFYSCNDYSFLQRSTCPFRHSRPPDLHRSSRLSEVSSSRDRAITNDAASQCRQLSYLPSVGKGKKNRNNKTHLFSYRPTSHARCCNSGPISFSHANCTAAVEPGVEITTFPRYTPAVARDSIAAAPTWS